MAAGLAKQGMIPVVAIYSTFLQRAYDMLLHDVALLHLHVVFAVDRSGLVGADGETHHGVFDVSYLSSVPGMQILSPSNRAELEHMLRRAVLEMDGPVAVRYPRGGDGRYSELPASPIIRDGTDLSFCVYGTMVNHALDAADLLAQRGVSARVVKLGQVWPLPEDAIALAAQTGVVLLAEETMNHCGIYEAVAAMPCMRGVHLSGVNLGDRFVQHGDLPSLYDLTGLSAARLADRAEALFREGKGENHEA